MARMERPGSQLMTNIGKERKPVMSAGLEQESEPVKNASFPFSSSPQTSPNSLGILT